MASVDILYDELYSRIRGFGYTTKGQTEEIVESVIDLITSQQLAQKTQENVHVIDGADWPEPDSGFAKLGGM